MICQLNDSIFSEKAKPLVPNSLIHIMKLRLNYGKAHYHKVQNNL
jgi:hypothetical protein